MPAANDSTAPDITHDALFDGAVTLRQPARRLGYRVNVDAILLAAFAARTLPGVESELVKRARHAIDLGAGVGAVALSLLHFDAVARATLIEVDPALAALARANIDENGWSERARVGVADVRRLGEELHASADLVVCNPPYVMPGRGRLPAPRHSSAKYGDLSAFTVAARRVAGRRARICFVYPSIEATTLLTALRALGLEPKRLRAVHARPRDRARVVLVEAVAGKAGGLTIEPPLLELDERGERSAELRELLATRRSSLIEDRRDGRVQSRKPRERSGD